MATLYGFIAIIMWGTLALLGSFTKEIPTFQLLFMCFALSSFIFFLYKTIQLDFKFKTTNLTRTDWLVGTLGLYGFHFCYFMALKFANALEVSLIAYLWPLLFTTFVASSDKRLQAIIGSLLGFVGIGFILSPSKMFSFYWQDLAGYLLAFCCAFIWSGYSWYFSHKAKKSVQVITAKERLSLSIHEIGYFSIVVSLLSLGSHLALETGNWQLSTEQLLAMLLLGLGPVGGAFYLWQLSLKSGNQLLLSSLSYCSPLFTAILLSLLGVSEWSVNITLAITLILIGAFIANLPLRIKTKLGFRRA